MNNNKEKRAKEIYFQYDGNKFQMSRDGISQEYYQYHISNDKEAEWLEELIQKNIALLDINSIDTLFPLWYIIISHCEIRYINNLIDFVSAHKGNEVSRSLLPPFISKIEDVIDRAEVACKVDISTLKRYRDRIESIKKAYPN